VIRTNPDRHDLGRQGAPAGQTGQERQLHRGHDVRPARSLPHPFHQLAEAGPGAGSQGVSGVPEIMEMDGWQPGRFERGQPYPAPEIGVPQRLPGRADEDEPLVSWLGEARQVPLDRDPAILQSGRGSSGTLVTARYATGLCVCPGRPRSRIDVMA
jgi:hypothetical protein